VALLSASSSALAEDGEKLKLTHDAVIDMVIERSFGLKQAEMERDYVADGVMLAKGIFDTYLDLGTSYEMDKSKRESAIFGDRVDTLNWDIALSKEMPSGTTLGLSFSNVRSKTFGSNVGGVPLIPEAALYEPVLGFSLEQPFLQNAFGINDRREYQQAKVAYAGADFALKRKVDVLVHQGLMDFWSILIVRRHIQAQRRAIGFARNFLSTTRSEYELGTAEKTDLLAAQANLLDREDYLLVLWERERTAAEALRRDLELEPGVHIEASLADPPFVAPGVFDDERIAAAFENRGDYQAVLRDVKRLNINLASAKNTRWPQLDLVSTLMLNDISQSYGNAVGDMDSPDVTVGLKFSFPLENRVARANARRAMAEKARAVYKLKDLENEIVNELSRRIEEVGSRKQIIITSRRTHSLQREKMNEEMKKYRMGRSSSYVVVQYQNDTVTAEQHLVDAWMAYRESVLGLWLSEGIIVSEQSSNQ